MWCLALFGPGATTAHQGTYFTEPVLIALGILGFWSVSRRLAVSVAAVSAAFTLWVYIAFTPVKAIAADASSAHNTAQATSSASAYLVVGIAACLASLWWLGTDEFDLGDPYVAGATSESHHLMSTRWAPAVYLMSVGEIRALPAVSPSATE